MTILQMSAQAGLMIAAVIVIRTFALYRLPKNTFLLLWGAVLTRMLVPFSFCSRWSVFNLLGGSGGKTHRGSPLSVGRTSVAGHESARERLADLLGRGEAEPSATLFLLWLGGAAALLVLFTALLVRSLRVLRHAVPLTDCPIAARWLAEHRTLRPLRILCSGEIASPLCLGILRPCIVFPLMSCREDEKLIQYMLVHEYVHVRRFDMLWKLLALSAVCVHWFNPLAWAMLFLFNRDLEISCDETVLRHFGGEDRGAYAHSLLDMADRSRAFAMIHSHFSRNSAEERIKAIMKYRKASLSGAALALVLTGGMTLAFAASAAPQTPAGQSWSFGLTGGEEGSDFDASDSQVKAAGRFSFDENGGIVPAADDRLDNLLSEMGVPEFVYPDTDGSSEISYSFADFDDASAPAGADSFSPREYTREEWEQIIADIESGKIQPFEMPEDENITVRFLTHPSCEG